jgi:hypothetical protein
MVLLFFYFKTIFLWDCGDLQVLVIQQNLASCQVKIQDFWDMMLSLGQ